MKIGFIGLGRMGSNLVLNAIDNAQEVVVYNRSSEKVDLIAEKGAIPAYSLQELVDKLPAKKVVWLMVTAGKVVDDLILELIPLLNIGDIIIDGGNSFFKDSIRRSKICDEKNISFLDIGTSGGVDGARNGACMMAGGDKRAFEFVEPFIKAVNVENGYGYMGKSGAGHYVKMIHNGIEYGMMQAIGEGYELLERGPFDLDLAEVSKVYANGSVIRSWLVALTLEAIAEDSKLEKFTGKVAHSGEGEWTVNFAEKLGINVPVIKSSLAARIKSWENPSYGSKVVSAMRYGFGRHKEA
jgi:6-phosphogluconate dehydrogenase